MRNRQWRIDSLTALFYRCVETYNYFSEPKFYLKTKMFTIWLYGLFHILAWYIVLEKMSLIRSSILNITPDFIFHLWFYCFSPCLLSLTHLLHVFNPHLKPFIVSCPVVLQVLLWGLCAYTTPSEDCPCRVQPLMLSALCYGVSLLFLQSKWMCCQGWSGIS